MKWTRERTIKMGKALIKAPKTPPQLKKAWKKKLKAMGVN